MTRLSILAVCLISSLAINFVSSSHLESLIHPCEVDPENPHRVELEEFISVDGCISAHTEGRIRVSGDSIVASWVDNRKWPTPTEYSEKFSYPDSGASGIKVTKYDAYATYCGVRWSYSCTGPGTTSIEYSMNMEKVTSFNFIATIYGAA